MVPLDRNAGYLIMNLRRGGFKLERRIGAHAKMKQKEKPKIMKPVCQPTILMKIEQCARIFARPGLNYSLHCGPQIVDY
jgi:predicted RNA binding protein YcfA (HicA-like mRNA interferase family)